MPTGLPGMLQVPSWIIHGYWPPDVAPSIEMLAVVLPSRTSAFTWPTTLANPPMPLRPAFQSSPFLVGDSTSTSTLPVASFVAVCTQAPSASVAARQRDTFRIVVPPVRRHR